MRSVLVLAAAAAAGCSNDSIPAPADRPPAAKVEPAAPTAAAGQEMVENADYANWKKFKVGTAVKRRSATARGANTTTSVETLTLKSVSDTEVVIERQNTTEKNDGSYKAVNPPEERKFYRAFALPAGMSAADFAKPSLKATAAGEETVTVLGKPYKAAVFKWSDGTEAGAMAITAWLSDDMPGRVVKQTMVVEALQTTTTDEVIELTVP